MNKPDSSDDARDAAIDNATERHILNITGRPRKWIDQAQSVAVDVAKHVYDDGFVLAGNFAYLSLLALFPFFVVAASLAGAVGRTDYGYQAVEAFLAAVPPSMASALNEPVQSAMTARTGPLLWLSVVVGLWTTASLIETIRDMIRRSYEVVSTRPFWHYRLGSIALIVGAVVLTIFALSAQVMLSGAEEFVQSYLPFASNTLNYIAWSQLFTTLVLFGALYLIFRTLTPSIYRKAGAPIWPGPLFISLWWILNTSLMPFILGNFVNYDLTYGSLAGVMVSLIFFFLIGLGMVIGAELNAALARAHDKVVKADDADDISEDE